MKKEKIKLVFQSILTTLSVFAYQVVFAVDEIMELDKIDTKHLKNEDFNALAQPMQYLIYLSMGAGLLLTMASMIWAAYKGSKAKMDGNEQGFLKNIQDFAKLGFNSGLVFFSVGVLGILFTTVFGINGGAGSNKVQNPSTTPSSSVVNNNSSTPKGGHTIKTNQPDLNNIIQP